MKEVILIEKDEILEVSVSLAKNIIAYSQKFYGFTMISRDTHEEMDEDAMLGALTFPIGKALERKKE